MAPVKWAGQQYRLARAHGLRIWPIILRDVIAGVCRRFGATGTGTPIYDREWDVVVILDACRYDLYQEVVGGAQKHRSPASMSERWMQRTFSTKYSTQMANTAYVTGNPFSAELDESSFALLDEVWRYAWDDTQGTVRAESITDRAIDTLRNRDDEYVIIHYMQPHEPFIAEENEMGSVTVQHFGGDADEIGLNIWEEVSLGLRDSAAAKRAYRANLEYVMEHVEILLENVDGTVAITADHGNALGEYGIWGHPSDIPLNVLRDVPWDIRECTDSHTYVPSEEQETTEEITERTSDRLAQLGYMG